MSASQAASSTDSKLPKAEALASLRASMTNEAIHQVEDRLKTAKVDEVVSLLSSLTEEYDANLYIVFAYLAMLHKAEAQPQKYQSAVSPAAAMLDSAAPQSFVEGTPLSALATTPNVPDGKSERSSAAEATATDVAQVAAANIQTVTAQAVVTTEPVDEESEKYSRKMLNALYLIVGMNELDSKDHVPAAAIFIDFLGGEVPIKYPIIIALLDKVDSDALTEQDKHSIRSLKDKIIPALSAARESAAKRYPLPESPVVSVQAVDFVGAESFLDVGEEPLPPKEASLHREMHQQFLQALMSEDNDEKNAREQANFVFSHLRFAYLDKIIGQAKYNSIQQSNKEKIFKELATWAAADKKDEQALSRFIIALTSKLEQDLIFELVIGLDEYSKSYFKETQYSPDADAETEPTPADEKDYDLKASLRLDRKKEDDQTEVGSNKEVMKSVKARSTKVKPVKKSAFTFRDQNGEDVEFDPRTWSGPADNKTNPTVVASIEHSITLARLKRKKVAEKRHSQSSIPAAPNAPGVLSATLLEQIRNFSRVVQKDNKTIPLPKLQEVTAPLVSQGESIKTQLLVEGGESLGSLQLGVINQTALDAEVADSKSQAAAAAPSAGIKDQKSRGSESLPQGQPGVGAAAAAATSSLDKKQQAKAGPLKPQDSENDTALQAGIFASLQSEQLRASALGSTDSKSRGRESGAALATSVAAPSTAVVVSSLTAVDTKQVSNDMVARNARDVLNYSLNYLRDNYFSKELVAADAVVESLQNVLSHYFKTVENELRQVHKQYVEYVKATDAVGSPIVTFENLLPLRGTDEQKFDAIDKMKGMLCQSVARISQPRISPAAQEKVNADVQRLFNQLCSIELKETNAAAILKQIRECITFLKAHYKAHYSVQEYAFYKKQLVCFELPGTIAQKRDAIIILMTKLRLNIKEHNALIEKITKIRSKKQILQTVNKALSITISADEAKLISEPTSKSVLRVVDSAISEAKRKQNALRNKDLKLAACHDSALTLYEFFIDVHRVHGNLERGVDGKLQLAAQIQTYTKAISKFIDDNFAMYEQAEASVKLKEAEKKRFTESLPSLEKSKVDNKRQAVLSLMGQFGELYKSDLTRVKLSELIARAKVLADIPLVTSELQAVELKVNNVVSEFIALFEAVIHSLRENSDGRLHVHYCSEQEGLRRNILDLAFAGLQEISRGDGKAIDGAKSKQIMMIIQKNITFIQLLDLRVAFNVEVLKSLHRQIQQDPTVWFRIEFKLDGYTLVRSAAAAKSVGLSTARPAVSSTAAAKGTGLSTTRATLFKHAMKPSRLQTPRELMAALLKPASLPEAGKTLRK